MPGSFVFRPLEANLTHSTDFLKKMDPYCAFIINNRRINGEVCKKGGKNPHWSEPITVPASTKQQKMVVEVMDKDRITSDDQIGSFVVDLQEIKNMGQVNKWYPIFYKNKPAGQILMESSYSDPRQGSYLSSGQSGSMYGSQYGPQSVFVGAAGAGAAGYGYSQPSYGQPGSYAQPGGYSQSTYGQQGYTSQSSYGQSSYVQREGMAYSQQNQYLSGRQEGVLGAKAGGLDPNRFVVEQKQTVQPHTFVKEIDVTETQPVLRQVQVYEPRTVIKDVQYTELVPVIKKVETVTPQKVLKDIQVMEPRLVTKTIEVIENVPVKKMVEVIESVPIQREIETYEQQTYTKEIEVTEQVPVKRQITVTEPVHLKKAVEFLEPIITTQTITKEIRPEVTLNQEITKSVGPATLKGIEQTERVLTERIGQINISEQERLRSQGYVSKEYWTEEERRLNQQKYLQGPSTINVTTTSLQNQSLLNQGTTSSNLYANRPLQNENVITTQQRVYEGTSGSSLNKPLQSDYLSSQQRTIEGGGNYLNKDKLLLQEEKYLQSQPVMTHSQEYYSYNVGRVENLEDFYSKFSKENRTTLQNKF